MSNYSNLYLQALVEANRRRTSKAQEEEELLRKEAEEESEDIAAEEEKADADAEAQEALDQLGEPTDDEVDAAEQEALEQEVQDVENLEDPSEYDVDPNAEALANGKPDDEEELDTLEREAEDPQPAPEEIPQEGDEPVQHGGEVSPEITGQIPEDGDFSDTSATDDQLAAAEGPVEGSDDEIPDFDYDDPPEDASPENGEVPSEGEDAPNDAEDPNAAPPDPAVQNIQYNILNLSKLDRALAKKHIYSLFMDLRASITTMVNIIDSNETVIDPEIREESITRLNELSEDLKTYISIKFQLVNYETAVQAYMIFVEQFNGLIEYVKNGGSDDGSSKHKNKGDP